MFATNRNSAKCSANGSTQTTKATVQKTKVLMKKETETKKIVWAIMDTLEADNTTALRFIAKEFGLLPESLLYHTLEAAGIVYANGKEPTRSDFFDALLVIGQEIDSEGIAWGIQERKRREQLKQQEPKKLKSVFA